MVNMRRSLIGIFHKAVGSDEASAKRMPETIDLARRVGFIRPETIRLERGSTRRVVGVFNPTIRLGGGTVDIYARTVAGYYKYVSMIAGITLDLSDVLSGCSECSSKEIVARVELIPSVWADFWGAEDPRYSYLGGREFLVYTGRTLAYFAPTRVGNTFPVVAERASSRWVKTGYITLGPLEAPLTTSIKNSFIINMKGVSMAFHRVHDVSGRFHLLASKIKGVPEPGGDGELNPIVAGDTWRILDASPFEEKIGWATPVHGYRGKGLLVLLHGVDTELQVYRVFSALLDIESGEIVVKGVTPNYIMEPRSIEETYGDRPYTVFPCGAWIVDGDILVSYGAADTAAGLALIPLDRVMELIDRGATGY